MGISHRCRIRCIVIGPCRPKWMKMVDRLYTGNPQETNNLSPLINYCPNHPDKIDRIAKCLHHRLAQDVHRRHDLNIKIGIEAITRLIQVCDLQRPVLATSFLRMVLILLETNRIDHQILAAKSFVEFSQIEDDTPNYLKEYNNLLDHFSSMAHASQNNQRDQNVVRLAGICGIHGVVRKTVGEQLHLGSIHICNMDKIIPSLLFNISNSPSVDLDNSQDDPSCEAAYVFQDICRSCNNSIKPVVHSILIHLDNHKLWAPSEFPLRIFHYLLSSIENTQSAHSLVKLLVAHLNEHESDFTLPERTCVVQVIGLTVTSLAKNAVGPDVFHNFKALLQILRASIDKTHQPVRVESIESSSSPISVSDEHQFQEAIINTIVEFAKNVSNTQKIEILKFILNFEPMTRNHFEFGQRPLPLSMVLLHTMLTIATHYQTVAISYALNYDFLNILLRGVAVDPDPAIRIIVQKILHTLIDRHGNTERLLNVQIYLDHQLDHYFVWEEPQRQDILFIKKTGVLFTENIYHQLLDPTNRVDCLEHLFCTIGLVALEMRADPVISELFRLILAVQNKIARGDGEPVVGGEDVGTDNEFLDAADGTLGVADFRCDSTSLLLPHKCALHALLASAISLLVRLVDLPKLFDHVKQVVESRNNTAPYLLPALAFNRSNTKDSYPTSLELTDDLLFSSELVTESLSSAGYEVSSLAVPYQPVYERLYDSANTVMTMMPDNAGFTDFHGAQNLTNYLFDVAPSVGKYPPPPLGEGGYLVDDKLGREFDDGGRSRAFVDHPNGANAFNDTSRTNSGYWPGPTRSDSSYSVTGSLSSMADSTGLVENLLSFANMRRVINGKPDVHDNRRRATISNDIRYFGHDNMEFNDIVAFRKEKTLTAHAQYAALFDDIAAEIQPLTANTSISATSIVPASEPAVNVNFTRKLMSTPSRDHSQTPQPPTAADPLASGGVEGNTNMNANFCPGRHGTSRNQRRTANLALAEKRHASPAMWERGYGALFLD